jgi:hypothetical protein
MPIQLHSLFEITESLKDKYIVIACNDYEVTIPLPLLALYEKHKQVHFYSYDWSKNDKGITVYKCVELPYNYGKGVV